MIIASLDLSDLKALRLTCKKFTFEQLTEQFLFKEVVLVPYSGSYDNAIALSNHEVLRNYVRKLTYDPRGLPVNDDQGGPVVHTRPFWALFNPLPVQAESKRDEHVKDPTYQAYHRASRNAQWQYLHSFADQPFETARLCQILGSLPALQSITIRCGLDGNPFDKTYYPTPRFIKNLLQNGRDGDLREMPESLQKLFEEGELQDWFRGDRANPGFATERSLVAQRTEAILLALTTRRTPLLDLKIHCFNETSINNCQMHRSEQRIHGLPVAADPMHSYQRSLKLFCDVVSSLTHLQLCYNDTEGCNVNAFYRSLSVILKKTTKIESVALRLSHLGTPIFAKILAPTTVFPHLRSLSINLLRVFEHDLVTFLTQQFHTLRDLELRNIILLEPDDSIPCWFRLLKALQRHLDLHSFKIGGVVSNGSGQSWKVHCWCDESRKRGDDVNGPCLLSRVQHFVTNGGDFPFDERLAPYADVDFLDLPAEIADLQEDGEDDCWYFQRL